MHDKSITLKYGDRKLYEAYLKKMLSLLKEAMNELATVQLKKKDTIITDNIYYIISINKLNV